MSSKISFKVFNKLNGKIVVIATSKTYAKRYVYKNPNCFWVHDELVKPINSILLKSILTKLKTKSNEK